MKKISLILVLTIICSMFSVLTPASVSAKTSGAEQMNLLLCLGAKTDKGLEETITVGDFATLLTASINEKEDYLPDGNLSDEEILTYAVMELTKSGLLEGDVDATVALDLATIQKALVILTGYEKMAQSTSYELQAGKIGIMDGVIVENKAEVTLGDAAKMIYNSLFIPLMEITSLNYTNVEYQQTDKIILTENRKIYRYRGLLQDNGITNLTGPSKVTLGNVKIGDYIMSVGETNVSDFLGYYVDALYSNIDGDMTVKCFKVTDRDNDVIVIPARMIEKNSDLNTIYYETDEKSEREYISAKASYIYNGKWTLSLDSSDIMPDNGQVTLIDIDFDGIYDVVMVDSYKTVVVKDVAHEDYVITGLYEGLSYTGGTYNDTYDFDSVYDEDKISVYKNGVEVEFSSIAPYDVIAVYESDEYLKIEICTYVENGTVKSLTSDGIKTEEGKELVFAPEFDAITANIKPELGDMGTFYFSKDKEIVYFDVNKKSAGGAGILHKLIYDSDEEQIYIKIFNENGLWEKLNVCEKVYVNDVKNKEIDLYKHPDIIDAYDQTIRQLIKYEKDDNGEVKRIYTVQSENIGEDVLQVAGEKDKQYKVSNVAGLKGAFCTGEDNGVADFYLHSTSVLFRVPSDPNNEFIYRVYRDGTTPYAHNDTPNMLTFYHNDLESKKNATIDYAVQMVDAAKSGISSVRFGVVMDFGERMSENDEIENYLTLMIDGSENTYVTVDGKVCNGIEIGDVLQINVIENKLEAYRKMYSINADMTVKQLMNTDYPNEDLEVYYNQKGIYEIDDQNLIINANTVRPQSSNAYNLGSVFYGTVTHKNGGYFTLNEDGVDYKLKMDAGAAAFYRTKVYVYDTKKKKVRVGTLNDVYVGTKILISQGAAVTTDIIVYK